MTLGFLLGRRVWQLLEGMAHGVSGVAGWDGAWGETLQEGWLTLERPLGYVGSSRWSPEGEHVLSRGRGGNGLGKLGRDWEKGG